MICRRCLLRVATQTSRHSTSRALSSISPKFAEATTAQTTTATHVAPAPDRNSTLPSTPGQTKQPVKVQSSVPAGTVLKGLNFMKNKQDPVALDDHEYPTWLWEALSESKEKSAKDELEGDLFAKSKKQRRRAAKALRRQQLLNPDLLEPKVPVYEQSIDLPSGDGTLAGNKSASEVRGELTQAMRQNRRAKIKEGNFLKAMR